MSHSTENSPENISHAEAAASATAQAGDTGGAYRAVAVVLALIVIAALAYGLIDTGIKASALFNNL